MYSFKIITATIIICLSTIMINSYGQGQESDFESIVENIKTKVGCDRETAEALISLINYFAEGIQSNLTYLASSYDSFKKKQERINFTINKYFENENSTVQVSSLTKNKIFVYTISEYLYRLSSLGRYKYTKVELLFRPDYLGIGTFNKIGLNKYELSVSMWQIFRGWIENKIAYQDATKKKFRLCFEFFDETKKVRIYINEILVSETINIEQYKKIFKKE